MASAQSKSTARHIITFFFWLADRYKAPLLDWLFDRLQQVPLLRSLPGMYEVLDYEATLELTTPSGREAIYNKRQKVRFLQDNIIAWQDKAWGDGDIFAEYHCIPGIEVDRYREGHRTHILISLRETKSRDEVEEFYIQRVIKNGFMQPVEEFQTEIDHRTQKLSLGVIFPANRFPSRVVLVEQNARRTTVISNRHQALLPDHRIRYQWETKRPRLYEAYIIRWEW